jgi:hypothetical protein
MWSRPASPHKPSPASPCPVFHQLPLLRSGAAVVFPYIYVLSGKLPYCHSVDWDSVNMHRLCLRPNCEVPITLPCLVRLGVTRRAVNYNLHQIRVIITLD